MRNASAMLAPSRIPLSRLMPFPICNTGGVLPNIHSVLLPKKTGKKTSGSVSQEF